MGAAAASFKRASGIMLLAEAEAAAAAGEVDDGGEADSASYSDEDVAEMAGVAE